MPLAVCDAAEALAPVECQVKWPNDVWLGERKLAGVLIEARPPDWAVIGVGLNLSIPDEGFPEDLRWPATSLGHGVGAGGAWWRCGLRSAGGLPRGPRRSWPLSRRGMLCVAAEIAWEGAGGSGTQGEGVAEGIDERGNLVVVTDSGERLCLGAGEVSLRL